MTLSYARQQQLDNVVKDFIEGSPDPRLLEFINNTEDTEVSGLPDPKLVETHKAREHAREQQKVREHLANLLNVSLHDITTTDASSNTYNVRVLSNAPVPDGISYDRVYGYIGVSQEYVNNLLYPKCDPAKNMLKHEASYMAPLHTNVAGGKQSHITRDYTLIPQEALASLARVMYNGALKYSKDNWKLIHKSDHLNHALNHINLYLAGNVNEDHLAHAATRMMMALELDLTEVNDDA